MAIPKEPPNCLIMPVSTFTNIFSDKVDNDKVVIGTKVVPIQFLISKTNINARHTSIGRHVITHHEGKEKKISPKPIMYP
jgi:hypothetical protein